jgi:hypothetical protein
VVQSNKVYLSQKALLVSFSLVARQINAIRLCAQMRAMACFLFISMSSAFASSDFYEAFDPKGCLRWSIDNEPHGIELSKEPKEYITAFELAKRQHNSWYKVESWAEMDRMSHKERDKLVSLYSAAGQGRANKYIAKFGACYGSASSVITCLPNQDFPLAGASYRKVRSKGALITLACVRGCNGVPAFIYDMGYENMEGERNIEHEYAKKKFRRLCGHAP